MSDIAMSSKRELDTLDETIAAELAYAVERGADGGIMHEVTRKRDLDMDNRNPAADEAYFRSAVEAWNKVRHDPRHANTVIFVTVGGYADDPRSLWDIPEVTAFVGRWIQVTGVLKDTRLSPMTRAMLQAIAKAAPSTH